MSKQVSRRLLLSLAPALPLIAAEPQTRLLFAGDVMLCRFIGETARKGRIPAWALREMASFLRSADITFANLESPFSDKGKPVNQGMVFKAEPDMVEALKVAGINIVSTANNHARDRGGYGWNLRCGGWQKTGLRAWVRPRPKLQRMPGP